MTTNAAYVARSVLSEAGIALTPNGEANVLAALETFGQFIPNRPVTVTIDGADMPVTEWLQGLTKSAPGYFAPADGSTGAKPLADLPANATLTEQMAHRVALEKSRNRARELATDAASGPNPWAAATRNVTRQMLILNGNPDLAATLQAEAAR